MTDAFGFLAQVALGAFAELQDRTQFGLNVNHVFAVTGAGSANGGGACSATGSPPTPKALESAFSLLKGGRLVVAGGPGTCARREAKRHPKEMNDNHEHEPAMLTLMTYSIVKQEKMLTIMKMLTNAI